MQRVSRSSSSKIINEAIKSEPFKQLIKLGCDEAKLVGLLTSLEWANRRETWESLTAMPPKRLRNVVARNLRNASGEINRINSSLGFFLETLRYPCEYKALPKLLTAYAEDLGKFSRTGGEKRHPFLNDLKRQLVRYVKETSKSFCDEEVSALLSQIIDKPSYGAHPYDATNHQAWRRKYYKK